MTPISGWFPIVTHLPARTFHIVSMIYNPLNRDMIMMMTSRKEKWRQSLFIILVLSFVLSPPRTLLAPPSRTEVVIQWELPRDFARLREVFIASFTQAYKDIPLEVLGVTNLSQFLNDAFSDDEAAFKTKDSKTRWVTASVGGKIAGFASFDVGDSPNEIYIRQLAIDPEFQKLNIGRKLVFSILDHHPDAKRLTLVVRRVNTGAIAFYEKLGFHHGVYAHAGYDKNKYCGLIFELIAQ